MGAKKSKKGGTATVKSEASPTHHDLRPRVIVSGQRKAVTEPHRPYTSTARQRKASIKHHKPHSSAAGQHKASSKHGKPRSGTAGQRKALSTHHEPHSSTADQPEAVTKLHEPHPSTADQHEAAEKRCERYHFRGRTVKYGRECFQKLGTRRPKAAEKRYERYHLRGRTVKYGRECFARMGCRQPSGIRKIPTQPRKRRRIDRRPVMKYIPATVSWEEIRRRGEVFDAEVRASNSLPRPRPPPPATIIRSAPDIHALSVRGSSILYGDKPLRGSSGTVLPSVRAFDGVSRGPLPLTRWDLEHDDLDRLERSRTSIMQGADYLLDGPRRVRQTTAKKVKKQPRPVRVLPPGTTPFGVSIEELFIAESGEILEHVGLLKEQRARLRARNVPART